MATRGSKSILFSTASLPLPCDILVNHIFLKLPLISLVSCKCVCNEWLRLLTDSYFIHLHHKHQKMDKSQKLLLGQVFYKEGLPGDTKDDYEAKSAALHGAFYSIHLQSSEAAAADAVRLRGISLDLEDHVIVKVLGCCNGMVCMMVCTFLDKEFNTNRVLIGNPSTGDYKFLPKNSFPHIIGFGYVSSLDDYKFVIIDRRTRKPHIFSLKLNSWKIISDSSDNGKIEGGLVLWNIGIALDTSIYWLVETSKVIVGFDLIDEEFMEFPLPFDMQNEMPDTQLHMTTIGGSLCVVNDCHMNHQVHLWLMLKNEGNNKNKDMSSYHWCMLMKVDLSDFGYISLRPLSFMKNEKLLCRFDLGNETDSFALIDPKTQRVENFIIRDETGGDWLQQFTIRDEHMGYVDSLLSPN